MKLTINGEPREVAAGTVWTSWRNWASTPRGPSSSATGRSWTARPTGKPDLSEGDVLELVRLVGGG